jgi:hypothetical protein
VLSASEFTTGWSLAAGSNPLPLGLSLSASGQIAGQARESGLKTFTVNAKNSVGTGPPLTLTISIAALPTNSVGTFYALVDRDSDVNQNLGAYLKITTAASGQISGTIYQGGGQSVIANDGAMATSFTGAMTFVPGAPDKLVCSTTVSPVTPSVPAGLPVVPTQVLSFTLTPSLNMLNGAVGANSKTVAFSATPANQWQTTPVAVDKQGTKYNFVINPPSVSASADRIDDRKPQGFGFGTFGLLADGLVTITGQTADGKFYSRVGVLTGPAITGTLSTTLDSITATLTVGDTTRFYPGMPIAIHPGIAVATTVASIVDSTTITLSAPAAASASAATTFGGAGEQLMFYSGAFNTLSSMLGYLSLTVSPTLVFTDTDTVGSPTTKEVKVSGNLTWMRKAEPTPSLSANATELARERVYRDGFQNNAGATVPLTYFADGGLYFTPRAKTNGPPVSTGILLNAPLAPSNARLSFVNARLVDTTSRTNNTIIFNDPDTLLTFIAPAVVVPPLNNTHTTFVSANVNVTTGRFSGSFDLKDYTDLSHMATANQHADFAGITIRQFFNNDTNIQLRGYGYFLLPQLPESGGGPNGVGNSDPATNSRMLAGKVTLK